MNKNESDKFELDKNELFKTLNNLINTKKRKLKSINQKSRYSNLQTKIKNNPKYYNTNQITGRPSVMLGNDVYY